jgi:small GTP-binding protein
MVAPTVGSGTSTKDVATTRGTVRLTIWDTAGEERYRSFTGLYSQGAVAAIIVFDVTDEGTFESIPTWVDVFKQATETGDFVVVVGNKLDLEDRVVTAKKALEWCDENKFKYFEVSAKTGEGVDLVFAQVAEHIVSTGANQPMSDVFPADESDSKCC